MSRSTPARAARHFKPGDQRKDGVGQALNCLVLAPGPDWVAVDLRSGALLRAPVVEDKSPETAAAESSYVDHEQGQEPQPPAYLGTQALRLGPPLSAVELVLADPGLPPDSSRPEAAYLALHPSPLANPRRRAIRHLLGHLVTRAPERPLLGTLGPSVSYSDLDGRRPSVVVVVPDERARFGIGPTGPWCEFVLAGRRHSVAYAGEPLWDHEGPTGRRRRATLKSGAAATMSKYLVVGYGVPSKGQVRKVVLSALPAV